MKIKIMIRSFSSIKSVKYNVVIIFNAGKDEVTLLVRVEIGTTILETGQRMAVHK